MSATRAGSANIESEIKQSSFDADVIARETNELLKMAVSRLDVLISILNKAYETNEEIKHGND